MLMDSLFHFRETKSTTTAVLQRGQVRSGETMVPWNIGKCVGEDLNVKGQVPFPRLINSKPDETVVFAWIVFESRAHRDEVNAKVMKDPRLAKMGPEAMPFDCKRSD